MRSNSDTLTTWFLSVWTLFPVVETLPVSITIHVQVRFHAFFTWAVLLSIFLPSLPHSTAIKNNKTKLKPDEILTLSILIQIYFICWMLLDKGNQPCRLVLQWIFDFKPHMSQQPYLAILPFSPVSSLLFATAAISKLIHYL